VNRSMLIAALVLGSHGVAYARDHAELVCAAVAAPADDGDRLPLFIHFFEHRAADGESRDERLSTIYQGVLFQATRVNKTGELAVDAPIVLSARKRIRFRGTFTLDNSSGSYVLTLKGTLNDDPSARKPSYREVAATIPCVDLSI